MELQTTPNTVCHDSIISYLASLYQMLSSAKPNWFATEMKGWQTAIHHRLYWGVCICARHLNVSSRRARGPAKWKANNSSRVMRILWWLSGLFMCLHVCDACVCVCTDVGVGGSAGDFKKHSTWLHPRLRAEAALNLHGRKHAAQFSN